MLIHADNRGVDHLDSGIMGSGNFSVSDLAVVGGNLYASGNFTNAGGVIVNRVAKWNGSAWSALGSGLARSFGSVTVTVLGARGNDLFAGGSIEYAGGKPSFLFARWNDQIDFDFVPTLQLRKPLYLANGHFLCNVTANGVPSYVIEGSIDLSSWVPLATNTFSSIPFEDAAAPGFSRRFYRARQGP